MRQNPFGTRQFRARFRVNVSGNGETIARLYQCWGCLLNVQPTMLLHHDRRGELLAAIGIDGSLWAHNIYGAFGEHLYKSASEVLEPFRDRFNGKEQDDLDGLSYYGHRFYGPVTFQWTSGDPLYRTVPELSMEFPQGLNIYAFSMDNPLMWRELNGLSVGDPHIDPFSSLDFMPPYSGTLLRAMATGAAMREEEAMEGAAGFNEIVGARNEFGTRASFWGPIDFIVDMAIWTPIPIVITPERDPYAEYRRIVASDRPIISEGLGPLDYLMPMGGAARVARGVGSHLLTREATTAIVKAGQQYSKHALERMADPTRGVTRKMVEIALEKGTKYWDPKNKSISYVLEGAFASGKDLLVGKNPVTGIITTVIRGNDLIRPRFILLK